MRIAGRDLKSHSPMSVWIKGLLMTDGRPIRDTADGSTLSSLLLEEYDAGGRQKEAGEDEVLAARCVSASEPGFMEDVLSSTPSGAE